MLSPNDVAVTTHESGDFRTSHPEQDVLLQIWPYNSNPRKYTNEIRMQA